MGQTQKRTVIIIGIARSIRNTTDKRLQKEVKIVKVSLCLPENDHFVEVWKDIKPRHGEPKYYGRYTHQDDGTWYYIRDPLGYCELSHPVSNEIVFLCCDKQGNEFCRYSNAAQNPLPKFETVVKEEWEKAKKKLEVMAEPDHRQDFWLSLVGLTGDRFKQWLLSFKDPERYGKEIEAMYGYDENWLYSCREELPSETVTYAAPMNLKEHSSSPKMVLHRKSSCEPIPGTEFTFFAAGKLPLDSMTVRRAVSKNHLSSKGFGNSVLIFVT